MLLFALLLSVVSLNAGAENVPKNHSEGKQFAVAGYFPEWRYLHGGPTPPPISRVCLRLLCIHTQQLEESS
jgi:hypothetical protein